MNILCSPVSVRSLVRDDKIVLPMVEPPWETMIFVVAQRIQRYREVEEKPSHLDDPVDDEDLLPVTDPSTMVYDVAVQRIVPDGSFETDVPIMLFEGVDADYPVWRVEWERPV